VVRDRFVFATFPSSVLTFPAALWQSLSLTAEVLFLVKLYDIWNTHWKVLANFDERSEDCRIVATGAQDPSTIWLLAPTSVHSTIYISILVAFYKSMQLYFLEFPLSDERENWIQCWHRKFKLAQSETFNSR